MRFTFIQFLFATSLVPLASALQTIYLATISFSGSNHYIAFFSDSNPCTDGTILGNPLTGFHNCDQRLTILGHENITFTGCPFSPGLTGSLPTGVADNGAPALKCKPASNPPNGPYGLYAFCPYIPGNEVVHVGGVNLLEYCS